MILQKIAESPVMTGLWKNYQRKFDYAADIAWEEVTGAVRRLADVID